MLLLISDPCLADHVAGPAHPERPDRLTAAMAAALHPELRDAIVHRCPTRASDRRLAAVHSASMLYRLAAMEGRRGHLDADTGVSERSVELARLAAGAGLVAVQALRDGDADAAMCAVRPPGHHATRTQSMGFCLLNNVAVTAAALVEAGERVLIADFDAHHGNGTEDCFSDDPAVLYVTWHQSPMYPGTGHTAEIGGAGAEGTTVNMPLPPGSTGDVYLESIQRLVGPIVDRFEPTWLLLSAGFDAHAHDPLTDMGLSSGDFELITTMLMASVDRGRTIAFLEGGYDLDALTASMTATMSALIGTRIHPEAPSSGGPSSHVIEAALAAHGLA